MALPVEPRSVARYRCPTKSFPFGSEQPCGWVGTEKEMDADCDIPENGDSGDENWSNWICPRCKHWHQLEDYEKIDDRDPRFTFEIGDPVVCGARRGVVTKRWLNSTSDPPGASFYVTGPGADVYEVRWRDGESERDLAGFKLQHAAVAREAAKGTDALT